MAIYTVHVPENEPDILTRGERTVFLREGFSLRAFVFGLAYLFWHRLWAAAAIWVGTLVVLALIGRTFDVPWLWLALLAGLMHVYLGVEGADLRRWALARRGTPMRDIVLAPGLAAAEALFFTRAPDVLRSPPPSVIPPRWPGPASVPAVIGMFPEGDHP